MKNIGKIVNRERLAINASIGVTTLVFSSLYKYFGLGPLISDEYTYFQPLRNGNGVNANQFGAFQWYLEAITLAAPLSQQWLYVIANSALLSCSISILMNLSNSKFSLKKHCLLAILVSSSGAVLYCATIMPEIPIIFLASLVLKILSTFEANPRRAFFWIVLISIIGVFTKPHFILVSVSALLSIALTKRESWTKKVTLLYLSLSSGIAILVFEKWIALRPTQYYYEMSKTLTLNGTILIKFLLFCVLSYMLVLMFSSGSKVYKFTENQVSKHYLYILTTLTILTYSFFSATIEAQGSFEADRLHGRYYLILLFSLLPSVIKRVSEDSKLFIDWHKSILIATSVIVASQLSWLNLYPWDDPFYSGLFIGESPWGWSIGSKPLLITFLIFSFILSFILAKSKRQNLAMHAIIAFFVSLTISSNIHNLHWLYVNKKGNQGASIMFAVENQTIKCIPADFQIIYVNPNLPHYIEVC